MKELISNLHFSSPEWALILPMVLIGIDFLTGIIYAFLSKTFQSSKMRSGLSKKVGEIVIIVLGELLSFALGLPKEIMNFLVLYISVMEIMSILENIDKMGVPIPEFIKRSINNVTSEDELEKAVKEITKEEKENE